jgi:serine/threonine protein kinase/formylglycine-generating enzyme required for sulfatase activity
MAASEPQQFGEFAVIEKLGQGAMGAVYKARQTSLNRIVALKLLPAHYAGDRDFLARFKNEAMAAAALNHPHIVQVYAAGEDNGTHFFAMEFVEGESLGGRLERKGRIEPREAIAVACHLAQALDYAWKQAKVIHRDIKPDNIFLSKTGMVKLGDLGLAKLVGNENGLTQTGAAMGTPYYVSPEQVMGTGEVDFRADIYSLGCTLFHTLTGQPPYRGPSAMAVMMQHVSQPPPRIQEVWPQCPPPIIGLLDRMLRKRPKERFESYEALVLQLFWVAARLEENAPAVDAAAASLIVPMPVPQTGSTPDASRKSAPKGTTAKTAPPSGGRGKMLAIAGGIAAAVIGLLAWQPWKKAASPAPDTPTPKMDAPAASTISTNAATPPITALASTPSPTPAPATPKPSPTPAPTPISAPTVEKSDTVPDADGFVSLLDSDHLGAWKHCGAGGVTLKDSVATTWTDSKTRIGCWWYSARQYADFNLRLEFRIESPGGNSGVYVRFPDPGNNAQVADRQGYQIDVSEEANPLEMTGAIAFVKAPTSVPQKSRDWNELEIEVVGQHYLIRLNGTLVNDFTGNKQTSGYIGLQITSKPVQFRNIRIKVLSSANEPAKPQSETEKWLVQMDATYLPMYQRDVTAPFESGMAELKKAYFASLDRESASATRAANLQDALAYRNERQRIEAGSGVPADDSDAPPAALKPLRAAYRAQSARLEADRRKHAATVFGLYDKVLATNEAALTQRQRLDEALVLQQRRDALAKDWGISTTGTTANAPAPAGALPAASKEKPFVNSLGMKFVPVPGTDILMCIHETRRMDYAKYAAETGASGASGAWKAPVVDGKPLKQEENHPVLEVSYVNAAAFCAWLSKKEGHTYRLPSEHEWNLAVAVGIDNPKSITPAELTTKIDSQYPWGTTNEKDAAKYGNYLGGEDGYEGTAPVMSFLPNHLGIYDLGGNAWEWCTGGPELGHGKAVLRGCDFGTWGPYRQSGTREIVPTNTRAPVSPRWKSVLHPGFRCVLEIGAPSKLSR